jgi:hypothetical protein
MYFNYNFGDFIIIFMHGIINDKTSLLADFNFSQHFYFGCCFRLIGALP